MDSFSRRASAAQLPVTSRIAPSLAGEDIKRTHALVDVTLSALGQPMVSL